MLRYGLNALDCSRGGLAQLRHLANRVMAPPIRSARGSRKEIFVRMRSIGLGVTVVAVAFLVALPVGAQAPTSASTWDPPRRADGQPNIEGMWTGGGGATTYSIEAGDEDRRVHLGITGQITDAKGIIVDPPDGRIPYQPWAAAKRKDIHENHTNPPTIDYIDPVARGCFLSGVPRVNYQGGNVQRILQPPGYVVMIHEFQHSYRVIPVNGRPPLGETFKLWMGESRGRWEGTTLVVEVTNHNDKTWFDIVGGFHSDALRVVERWTFVDANTLAYEATLEDPKTFARPWTIKIRPFTREKMTYEQWEDACVEGNRSLGLMLRK